ncbi:hypothetical protein [Acidisoma sp. C75]
MILVRILSVIAAMFLVAAFAVASIWPPDATLGLLLAMADSSIVPRLQQTVFGLSPWLWSAVIWPVMERPAWLLPTAIGLVAFGGAISLSGSRSTSRPRRWRG